jgi:hypothetical protein
MDLERKFIASVEDFAQDREMTVGGWPGAAEDFTRIMFHEPAQIFAGERAVEDDAFVAGTIGNFPGFADGFAGGERLGKEAFQLATAPDALLKKGLKDEGVEQRID